MPAPAQSSRVGLIVVAIAVLVILVAGGYFGYGMLYPGQPKDKLAAGQTADTQAPNSAPAPPAEPPKDGAAPAATDQPAGAQPADASQTAPIVAPAPAGAPPNMAATTPDASAQKGSAVPKPKAAATTDKAQQAGVAPPPKAATAPAPAPKAAAPAASAHEPPKPDRWQMMADAIKDCGKQDFFARVVCEQKVRIQYCEGYWNSVPQCTSVQQRERGN